MTSPPPQDPISFTLIGDTLQLAQGLRDALDRARPADFQHVTLNARDMADTCMADVWIPLTGPIAIVYMTDDNGGTPDAVVCYMDQVPAHHRYRVLPPAATRAPACTRSDTTSIRLLDLAGGAPRLDLWEAVRDEIMTHSIRINRLDILIVTDAKPLVRILADTLRARLSSWNGHVAVSHTGISAATRRAINIYLNAQPGVRTPRTDTKFLIAVFGLGQDGRPTAAADAWLGENPSAHVYYYVPDGVEKVQGRPALAHIKPSSLADRGALCDLVWGPILEKARNRHPQDDPEGLRNLIP
jgi:hypothetical protein